MIHMSQLLHPTTTTKNILDSGLVILDIYYGLGLQFDWACICVSIMDQVYDPTPPLKLDLVIPSKFLNLLKSSLVNGMVKI